MPIQGLCEVCHTAFGRTTNGIEELEQCCHCPDRLFHYHCLIHRLYCYLDQPCPHCRQSYVHRNIERKSYTPSASEFFFNRRMLPNWKVVGIYLIAIVLIAVFKPEDTTGFGYPTLITVLVSMHLHQVYLQWRQMKNSYPHTLLTVKNGPTVDITEERRLEDECMEDCKRQMEEWRQSLQRAKREPKHPNRSD